MLDAAHTGVQQECALFDLGLFTDKVLDLLSEEILLVDIHVLEFAEVALEVHDILHNLFQGLIIKFDRLMLEGGQLTAKQLALFFVLVEILVELNNVRLGSDY